MAVVVFCTTYALILPALTLELRTNCGMEEHTHTEDCYTTKAVAKQTIVCTPEENADFVVHTHDDMCYDYAGNLICQLDERSEHAHTEDCYDEDGNLICEEVEVVLHTHSDDCYDKNNILTCGMPQVVTHQHTADCIKTAEGETVETKVLDCDKQEHTHTDQCFEEPDALTFTYEDDLVSGVITVPNSEDLPDNIECTVVPLDEDDSSYSDMVESVNETLADDNQVSSDIQLYSLEWTADGEAYELSDDTEATAELTLLEDADDTTVVGVTVDDTKDETANIVSVESNVVTMSLKKAKALGVAAVTQYTTVTGDYWRRLSSVDEIKNLAISGESYSTSNESSYNKFMLVYDNGMYALEGTCTVSGGKKYLGTTYPEFKFDKVEVQQVAGNTNYVQIKTVANGTICSPSNTPTTTYTLAYPHNKVFLLRELGAANKAWSYLIGGNSTSFSDNIDFEYDSDRQAFHMFTSQNGYLASDITPDESEYSIYTKYDPDYASNRGTLDATALHTNNETVVWSIKKSLQDVTSSIYSTPNSEVQVYVYENKALKVPDFSKLKDLDDAVLPRADKVTYDAYQTTSSAKTGTEEDTGYQYASDNTTSNIESILGAVGKNIKVEDQDDNDGRIVTDKSVVYKDDDYNAFSDYSDGEFSVTMSALGQEWTVEDAKEVATPIDVMFVIDLSGSMTALASTKDSVPVEGETEAEAALREKRAKYQRWQTVVDALNESMKQILSYPNNRVGVVCFSNDAITLLPLGRYVVASSYLPSGYIDGYISYDESKSTADEMRTTLATSPALFYEKDGEPGVLDANKYYSQVTTWKSGLNLWSGTYTQLGIQEAYNNFKEVDDDAHGRKPVTILMSDGEPTFGTFNYMDPASGPRYGVGTVGENGSLGYYTILSANYFKRMTSIEYGCKSAYYTVGFGINETGYGSYLADHDKDQATGYYADDAYRRAVLSPTKDNIDDLETMPTYNYTKNALTQKNMNISYSTASKFLYTLLTGSNQAQYIQNIEDRYLTYDSSTGYVNGQIILEQWLRTINNPYASDYSYADDSKIYGDFDVTMLESFLNSIIKTMEVANNYGFLLQGDSDLVMTDPLGTGMEIKGTPVLSYFGTLYKDPTVEDKGSYIEYTWNQKVKTQNSDTKGSQELDLSSITARVYTTNAGMQTVVFTVPEKLMPTLYPDLYKQFYYEELPIRLIYKVGLTETAVENAKDGDVFYTNLYDDDTGQAATTATFTPDSTNNYYKADFKEVDKQKTQNTTGTSSTYFTESVESTDSNSVKVTQTLGNNGKIVVNKEDTGLDLNVSKVWTTTSSDFVQVELIATGTTTQNGTTQTFTEVVDTATLDKDNKWNYSWSGLPSQSSDGTKTYTEYYIREIPIDGYTASYKDANDKTISTQQLTVKINNKDEDVYAVSASSGKVVITNTRFYSLPSTGGSGTYQFTFVGLTLMIVAGFMYIIIYRRNKNRNKEVKGDDFI
jgi:LPXTG-motif cell wall-anchored protein